jgi:hypothetical protein
VDSNSTRWVLGVNEGVEVEVSLQEEMRAWGKETFCSGTGRTFDLRLTRVQRLVLFGSPHLFPPCFGSETALLNVTIRQTNSASNRIRAVSSPMMQTEAAKAAISESLQKAFWDTTIF